MSAQSDADEPSTEPTLLVPGRGQGGGRPQLTPAHRVSQVAAVLAIFHTPRWTARRRGQGGLASRAIVAVGALAIAAYFTLPGQTAKDLGYSGIGVVATLALAFATWWRRPIEQLGWYLLAAANACFVLGDGVYDIYDLVLHRDTPFPSIADALYLAGYPLLFIGVARVSRLRSSPGAREARADAAMVSVGALALSWHFLMTSYAHDTTLSQFGKVVTLAYPVMDLGVLFILVGAMTARSARRPADTLLALSVAVMVAADFVYDLLVLHSAYAGGNAVDAAFLLGYVLMAAAAAHPSVSNASPVPTTATTPRVWLPLVAIAGFVSPTIVVISSVVGAPADAGFLAGTSIALCALAVVRVRWLFERLRANTTELQDRGRSLQNALSTRQALEDDLRHQAFHDHLTGLANRALLHDRVEHALESSARRSGIVAVCFCDLDGFKSVNDTLGHQVGDNLLITAAKRLASVVRVGDTVARLGGDEFAVLLENLEDPAAAIALADRVVSVLRQPIEVGDQQLSLSVSVGIAFASPGTSTARLLSEADAAMYEAKSAGKDRYAVFETVMRSRIVERMALLNSFPGSLHRGEFILEYQPQLRLSDGSLEGFEALVRWNHPELGLIGPDRFIPLAEESGFIVPLGRWILEQACVEAAGWPTQSETALSVSVNLSVRQLQKGILLEDVRTALSFSGLPPQQLILEITETVLMQDAETIATSLAELKSMGIRIAIDDFGTGYSSLSYLRQFPVDILKIDKSFVDPLQDSDNEGDALVTTILRLAEKLHLTTTAEGIENQAQHDALVRLNCDSAQGYLMSRPLGPRAALDYIIDAAGTTTLQPADRQPL